MRKFLLIFLMTFFLNSAQAVEFKPLEMPNETTPQNEQKALLNDKDYKFKGRVEYDEEGILLLDSEDVDHLELKINLPSKYPKKSVLSEKEIFSTLEEQRRYETPKIDEYLINPTFGELTYQSGKFSYGTTFGTEIDTAQLEYRTKLFTRYDTKRFGIMTAIGKDAYTSSGRQLNSVYIVPEIKLGKGFTLVDAFKANPEADRFRNEIMLQYRPKIRNSRENLSLEAGVSQTSYYTSGEKYYQFSISTKFKL